VLCHCPDAAPTKAHLDAILHFKSIFLYEMSLKSILAIAAVAAVTVSANPEPPTNPRSQQSTIDETWGVKPPHQQEGESVWQKYAKNPDIPTLQKAAHDKYAPILRKHLEKAEDLDELQRKAEQLGEHAKTFLKPRTALTKPKQANTDDTQASSHVTTGSARGTSNTAADQSNGGTQKYDWVSKNQGHVQQGDSSRTWSDWAKDPSGHSQTSGAREALPATGASGSKSRHPYDWVAKNGGSPPPEGPKRSWADWAKDQHANSD
jgi:hypothetical protein